MQSRLGSFAEAWANVFIGWLVALVSQVLIFPLFGIIVPLSTNLKISVWFTVISVVRSYIVRRLFNSQAITSEAQHRDADHEVINGTGGMHW